MRGWRLTCPVPAMAFVPRAGGTVVVTEQIRDDLYVAGGTVEVTGDVDGMGGTVTLGGSATGGILASGGNVTIGAEVGRDLVVASMSPPRSAGEHTSRAGW